MMSEAGQAWHDWYPFGWQMIKFLGLLKETGPEGHPIEVQPRRRSSLWRYFRSFWRSRSRSHSGARPQ
jgi:hypothetical protein